MLYLSAFSSLDFLDLYQIQVVINTASPADSNRTTRTTTTMVVVLLAGVGTILVETA